MSLSQNINSLNILKIKAFLVILFSFLGGTSSTLHATPSQRGMEDCSTILEGAELDIVTKLISSPNNSVIKAFLEAQLHADSEQPLRFKLPKLLTDSARPILQFHLGLLEKLENAPESVYQNFIEVTKTLNSDLGETTVSKMRMDVKNGIKRFKEVLFAEAIMYDDFLELGGLYFSLYQVSTTNLDHNKEDRILWDASVGVHSMLVLGKSGLKASSPYFVWWSHSELDELGITNAFTNHIIPVGAISNQQTPDNIPRNSDHFASHDINHGSLLIASPFQSDPLKNLPTRIRVDSAIRSENNPVVKRILELLHFTRIHESSQGNLDLQALHTAYVTGPSAIANQYFLMSGFYSLINGVYDNVDILDGHINRNLFKGFSQGSFFYEDRLAAADPMFKLAFKKYIAILTQP